MQEAPLFPFDSLTIITWPNDLIDRLGHDPRSHYVEKYWLGVLGPSTTFLLRLIALELESQPSGFTLRLEETATQLGLGMKGGRHSPFKRALGRLVQFDMAQQQSSNVLAVRRRVPTLSRRHLARLTESLRVEHEGWQARQVRQSSASY